MHLPDRSDWKGSDAMWGQLTTVRDVCRGVESLDTDNLPLKQFLAAISGFGQAVVDQTMKEDTPGSALIGASDSFLEVLRALPPQIPLYANYTERHCLGHTKHGGRVKENSCVDFTAHTKGEITADLEADDTVDVSSIEATSKMAQYVYPSQLLHPMEFFYPIDVVSFKHKNGSGRNHCDNYVDVQLFLGEFKPEPLMKAMISLKEQMKSWHKSVMHKRAEDGWKDLHSLAFREWHGNLGTRKNITYLVRFCQEIKEKYYEDELLLNLAKELNNLCYEISHGSFTGLNSYIDALVK